MSSLSFVLEHGVTARDFTFNKEGQKALNIGSLGPNFEKHFFGKTHKGVGKKSLCFHRVEGQLNSQLIVEDLGRRPVPFSAIIRLIKLQSQAENGFLLTNSKRNLAYVEEDEIGWLLKFMYVPNLAYWEIEAHSVYDGDIWCQGDQIISLKA